MQRLVGAQMPPNRLLYMELSDLLMQHHWAGLVFRFWNSMVGKPGSLCHSAFRSDVRLALEDEIGWTHDVLAMLSALGFSQLPNHASHNLDELVGIYATMQLPVDRLLTTMAESLLCDWFEPGLDTADPRTYEGYAGSSVCRYRQWMGMPEPADHGGGCLAALPHMALIGYCS